MDSEFKVSQNDLVDLFCLHIQNHGTQVSHGVYNKADPTHFEKWEARFGIVHGYTSEIIPIEDGGNGETDFPEPENIKVLFHDVTWGVEFEIHTSVGVEKAYWSRSMFGDKGEWLRVTPNFFKQMRDVWFHGKEPDWWIAEDNLAQMGYYSCR